MLRAGLPGHQYSTERFSGCSDAEWQVRCDLAACYQLVDFYGMSDMAATHISARVPGDQEHFLINPLGLFFDEITASSLIKVDVDGHVIEGNSADLNPAGFVIHSAIHLARPDLICVLHTHTRANNAVAMQADGLLPLTQKALLLWDYLRYHDFEGAALDLSERERIVRDLGDDGRILILRNHGALTVGASVAEAFMWMYRLETSCRYQVDGLGGGRELNILTQDSIEHTARQGRKILGPGGALETGRLEWPALLRKLERERGTSFRG
ncbi:class II aldolase/adducin family protein [Sphingomonas sp. Root710]|uniref:class II aldolase/adducin family protein n=1 Tax=Sphingomonas sp. Root710 TaxID=1736594 RepID=UPI0009EAA4EC|nr:class II aldolase/adducin family protein [Sphingomonas sp. Root710]